MLPLVVVVLLIVKKADSLRPFFTATVPVEGEEGATIADGGLTEGEDEGADPEPENIFSMFTADNLRRAGAGASGASGAATTAASKSNRFALLPALLLPLVLVHGFAVASLLG